MVESIVFMPGMRSIDALPRAVVRRYAMRMKTVTILFRRRLDGLEFWFRSPGARVQTPSAHKMVFVIIPIVFAITSVIGPLLRWLLSDVHSLVRLAVAVTVQVVLMTYVIMPRVTQWLRGWLFR